MLQKQLEHLSIERVQARVSDVVVLLNETNLEGCGVWNVFVEGWKTDRETKNINFFHLFQLLDL